MDSCAGTTYDVNETNASSPSHAPVTLAVPIGGQRDRAVRLAVEAEALDARRGLVHVRGHDCP